MFLAILGFLIILPILHFFFYPFGQKCHRAQLVASRDGLDLP